MLEGLVNMAWASVYSGGAIGDLLYQWEQMGVFAFVLPFLLIFAVVYGILSRTKIFDSQPVNAIISIVVGLMALQFEMVSLFFAEIFPRLGVGLSIILVILITLGMFIPTNKDWVKYVLLAVTVIIAGIIIGKSLGVFGWTTGGFWSDNWVSMVTVLIVLLVIGAVVGGGSGGKTTKATTPGNSGNSTETLLGNILAGAAGGNSGQ